MYRTEGHGTELKFTHLWTPCSASRRRAPASLGSGYGLFYFYWV